MNITKVFIIIVVLFINSFFIEKGFAMSDIKCINFGVVSLVEKSDNCYIVTLDNGVTGRIPVNNPVREAFLGKNVFFPHFKNDGIALVQYSDNTSDWMPARLAIAISGNIVIDKKQYSFQDMSFDQFSSAINKPQYSTGNNACAYISSLPVPSSYRIIPDDQFARHNFDTIKMLIGAKSDAQLFDIVYGIKKDIGFTLVYIQPSRFTKEYCEMNGITTNQNNNLQNK